MSVNSQAECYIIIEVNAKEIKMFSAYEKEMMFESAKASCRWYFRNQNTNENPWGGMRESADNGRFIYEWFPALKVGRGGVVWSQALATMALDAVNLRAGKDADWKTRRKAALLGGKYLMLLQHDNPELKENYGGFSEQVPGEMCSYPRDAATGAMGLCALYRISGDKNYLYAAERFAHWFFHYGSDSQHWPYITFDFASRKGHNFRIPEFGDEASEHVEYVPGDWQAGGALVYFMLASLTGNRKKYIDEYMLPVIERLVKIYEENPFDAAKDGFHGEVPISYGNDDFAIVTLLAAYVATKRKKYYNVAKDRVMDFFKFRDEESGLYPSFAGTFVSGITMAVLRDLDRSIGVKPDSRLECEIRKTALNGLKLQNFDYSDLRANGAFWCQTQYGVGRDHIHHRSTGYSAIFYSMLSGSAKIPYYHCLNWELPK